MFTSRLFTKFAAFITVFVLALSSAQAVYAAPANDNFAGAIQITALPYNANADNTGATGETGEPTDCVNTLPLKTVWFSYTPSANSALMLFLSYPTMIGIYTGNSVDSLGFVGCAPWYYGQFSFVPQAGITYYFQLSDYFGNEGNLSFRLELAPPPQVNINYSPSDPSIYDNVSFYANIYDPAGIYGDAYDWAISDGTTDPSSQFSHQFAADGDYTVNLTFFTLDGRSNSANTVVQVRTRDIAINKLVVPQSARVNQTKAINVDIKNKRYSDYVQVSLFKGLPGGGEQLIGTLTLYVPARATRPTTFRFSYTYTAADASIGKVTFRAEANIVNGRDALPSDNQAIATTLVTK
jgi:PKD domain